MLSHQRENTTKKEKVVTVKSMNIGLPDTRKKRALKEQIETFVEGMTPLKKSNTQQDTSNKEKHDEIQKHTQSKTKEVVTTKSRVSVLNYLTDKEEKATSNDLIPLPVNIEVVPFDKDSTMIAGDNLCVYYGDEQATTYDVKFIDKCGFERAMKYYANYKGWNSGFDEVHIASKTKDPEPEPEIDNDTHSLKISRPDHTQSKTKEVVTSKSRVSVLISVFNYLTDKEEKATSNDLIPLPVNIEVVPFDKDLSVIVSDNLCVYYGDEQATTYDVKFIDKCGFERAMKYYANYKGWNSRFDVVHIARKTKDLEPEPEIDNDTHSLKISLPELSENTMPSTSKSVYYSDSDVNSVLFCEETIPISPTSTSEEQNNQEERKIGTVPILSPEMNPTQRQALILAEMNKVQSLHEKLKRRIAIINKRLERIKNRKIKMANATTTI